MSAVEDILGHLPLDQIAGKVGADPTTVELAMRAIVPSLMQQLQSNAADPDGEAKLASALNDHQESTLLDGGVNLDDVDTADGAKIASHVFGGQQDQEIKQIAGQNNLPVDLIKKLLPIIAPIVIAYLAKQVASGKYGDILGPILGGLAGGGQQAPAASSSGNILGDVLGQLIGGGAHAPAQPAPQPAEKNDGGLIGNILGSILGGKK